MTGFLKPARSRRGPALRQQTGSSQSRFFIQVSKYFLAFFAAHLAM